VVYSRSRVEKLPRSGLRLAFFRGKSDGGEEGKEGGVVESGGGSDLDWESWIAGQWPHESSVITVSTLPVVSPQHRCQVLLTRK